MISTDVRVNFHLKREILLLASEISARDIPSTEDYVITRDELRGIDIPDQNVVRVLPRHLDALREIRITLQAQRPESSFSSSLTSMHGQHGDVAEQISPAHHALPIFIRGSPKNNQPHRNGTVSDRPYWQRTGHLTQRCRSALLLVAALLLFALSNSLWSSIQQFRSVPAGEPHH